MFYGHTGTFDTVKLYILYYCAWWLIYCISSNHSLSYKTNSLQSHNIVRPLTIRLYLRGILMLTSATSFSDSQLNNWGDICSVCVCSISAICAALILTPLIPARQVQCPIFNPLLLAKNEGGKKVVGSTLCPES